LLEKSETEPAQAKRHADALARWPLLAATLRKNGSSPVLTLADCVQKFVQKSEARACKKILPRLNLNEAATMNVLRTNNTQATKISLRLAVAEAVSGTGAGWFSFLFGFTSQHRLLSRPQLVLCFNVCKQIKKNRPPPIGVGKYKKQTSRPLWSQVVIYLQNWYNKFTPSPQ
jgi:hypothetical protein